VRVSYLPNSLLYVSDLRCVIFSISKATLFVLGSVLPCKAMVPQASVGCNKYTGWSVSTAFTSRAQLNRGCIDRPVFAVTT
jgi:hypothetical protein